MDLIQTNKLETLPLRLQSFAISRIGKKSIKDLHEAQVKQSCSEIINLCFVESGQIKQATSEMLAFNRDALFNELKGKFKDLTLEELKEAFKMGVRGEFGDYFGLCAATYHKWIKSYFERPERAEAMRVFLSITNEVKLLTSEPSPEQKEQIMKGASINAFNEYKASKKLPFVCRPIYDFLKSKGLINWSESEKKEMSAYVKERYKSDLLEQKTKGEISSRDFRNIVENLDGEKNKRLINKAKTEGLKRYFDNLIKNNQTIDFNGKGI